MEKIEKAFDLKKTGRVLIHVTSADIKIRGGDEEQARVSILRRHEDSSVPSLQSSPEELKIMSGEKEFAFEGFKEEEGGERSFSESGDLGSFIRETVRASLRGLQRGISAISGSEGDLEIILPKGVALEVVTSSGNLFLEDWQGKLDYRTYSGDLHLRDCAGEARLRSSSGDLYLEGFKGPLTLNSTSGDINLRLFNGEIHVETISGDVNLERGEGSALISSVSGDISLEMEGGELSASTTSGDLRANLKDCPALKVSTVSGDLGVSLLPKEGGQYFLQTTSGDLRLRVPRDARLEVKVATLTGDFSTDLPLLHEQASEEKLNGSHIVGLPWLEKGWVRVGHKFSGVLNAKSGVLELKTVSGDISLRSL